MKRTLLAVMMASSCAATVPAVALDTDAVVGGALGGAAGAAVGSAIGGREGAVIGAGLGGAAGAAIATKDQPKTKVIHVHDHHDNGLHRGHYKHKHKHHHDD